MVAAQLSAPSNIRRRENNLPLNEKTGMWFSNASESGQLLQAFGLKLLQNEWSRTPGQNVFLSPLSIFLVLLMLEKGARGNTRVAIREALGSSENASAEEIEIVGQELMNWVRAQAGADCTMADALWTHITAGISPNFVNICRERFDAEARTLDFTHPSAAIEINSWAAEKTRGMISEIVSPDAISSAVALITNAVYFKGTFQDPFWEELTAPQPFHLSTGSDKIVSMMKRGRMSDAYWCGENCEAAEFQYCDTDISLVLVLPDKGLTPEEVLTQECLSGLSLDTNPVGVVFEVPRFTIDFESALTDSLTHMGMGIAFSPGADFSLIGSPNIFISDVVHKAHLKVDEQGTIASAATESVAYYSAAFDPDASEPRKVVFDRPFAVLLRDQASGMKLFEGVIYEP
jgi:serine protease inhibitor